MNADKRGFYSHKKQKIRLKTNDEIRMAIRSVGGKGEGDEIGGTKDEENHR